MKKYLAILFFSLLGATANAGIISFEGLITDESSSFSELGISNTYQDYLWSASSVGDWGVADCATIDCMGIQPLEAVSGTSYGWTFNGPQSLFIDFGETTDVVSAYFAGQFGFAGVDSQAIQLFGYNDQGTLVSTSTVLDLATDQWKQLLVNFTGIHRLEIRSDRDNSWFVIDDLVVNASAVPIPAAVWLFGSAILGLLGYSARRAHG
jgi:hypothetical protein